MTLIVEDNIPLPASATSPKFPWATMKPGESFTVQGTSERNRAHASFRIFRQAHFNEHNILLKIVTRKIGADSYRVWLVEAGAQ